MLRTDDGCSVIRKLLLTCKHVKFVKNEDFYLIYIIFPYYKIENKGILLRIKLIICVLFISNAQIISRTDIFPKIFLIEKFKMRDPWEIIRSIASQTEKNPILSLRY